LGGSTTESHETNYSVPPTTILNQSNVLTVLPQWTFGPQSLPLNTDFQVNPSWTWYIPQDAYPAGGTNVDQILFENNSGLLANGANDGEVDQICFVPIPFSQWYILDPVITSLTPTSTSSNGGVFTITGLYLYPSSVSSVLIGGKAVPLNTNVDLINDTTIEVTVPGGYFPGTYPVQVVTQFNEQNTPSNTMNLTLTN
jgi:hypothetical protein